MTESSEKRIISHGKIYLAGNILQRCVSFIMLPIYTRFLLPADYGTIELLSMVLDFISIILGLRIGQALFRFYADYDTQRDKREVISTAIYLVFLLNVFGVVLLFLVGDYITMAIFNDTSQKINLSLFSLTLLMQGFIEIPMTYIRAMQRPWLFVTFSIAKLIIQLSLNITFVVLLDMKVEGVIYSAVISSFVMASMLAVFIIKNCGVRFSFHKAKQLVSFSFPMVLTSIISFYITFGDRYFLKKYIGLDAVGVYSLAYKFGFLLVFLVGTPFSAIWDSEKYIIAKKDNAEKIFGDIFVYFSTIVILVCIVLSVFIKDILHIMAAPPFWGAAEIVPIVLAAYVANLWFDYLSLGILLNCKTIEITYGTLLASVVITIGYFTLIPQYGAIGAAWATVFAFTTRALWGYFRAKRLLDMGIKWHYPCFLVVLWGVVYGLSNVGQGFNLYFSLLWNSVLVAFALSILLFNPFLPHGVRSRLLKALKKPKTLFSTK